MMSDKPLLEVRDLEVSFGSGPTATVAVDGISFDLAKGQCLGIVGESGSGKTVTSLSILNLLTDHTNKNNLGSINFTLNGKHLSLLDLEDQKIQNIRGNRISMIFQEPRSSFNPVRKCGAQVKEVLNIHGIADKNERKQLVLEQFRKVALTDVDRIYNSYPHQLSGGQLQRIAIASALISKPDLVICDEPTTALDVTTQMEIIDLLKHLNQAEQVSMIFVSHDLDVVATLCDHTIIMRDGKIIESGRLPDAFLWPQEDYTRALMACKPNLVDQSYVLPTIDQAIDSNYKSLARPKHVIGTEDIISAEQLTIQFPKSKSGIFSKKEFLTAVDNVSFSVKKGGSLGIVGESGSGKSTIANCLAGLLSPSQGRVIYRNQVIRLADYNSDKKLRRAIQMVFQDPYSSLNPAMTVGQSVIEAINYHGLSSNESSAGDLTIDLFRKVGLNENYLERYPHQLSGGQRQRVCIARSLSVSPDILICDECVSALDVSVQAQILNLLDQLRRDLGLTLIFISHDLAVVNYICDDILVMEEGKIVEQGPSERLISNPQQPYTQRLINSLPPPIQANS